MGDELRTPPQRHVPPQGWEKLSALELVQTFVCALGTCPCQKQPLLPAHGPVSDHISWEQAMGQGAAVSQLGGAGVPPCLWEKFELTQEHFTSSGRMELGQRNIRSGKHQFFQTWRALFPINAFGVLPLGCRRGREHLEQRAGEQSIAPAPCCTSAPAEQDASHWSREILLITLALGGIEVLRG